jgi:hypothetical protein
LPEKKHEWKRQFVLRHCACAYRIQLTAPYQREINNVEFEPLNAKIQDDFAHLGSADRFQRQGLALQRYRSSIKETTKVA